MYDNFNLKLSLDDIKNRTLDETIELYRQGYRLEGADDNESYNVEYQFLNNNRYLGNNNKIVNLADGISISTGALILIGVGILGYIYLTRFKKKR